GAAAASTIPRAANAPNPPQKWRSRKGEVSREIMEGGLLSGGGDRYLVEVVVAVSDVSRERQERARGSWDLDGPRKRGELLIVEPLPRVPTVEGYIDREDGEAPEHDAHAESREVRIVSGERNR